MRELKILIRPGDLYVRCVTCNKRQFCRLPRFMMKAIFYLNAIRHKFDWLDIIDDDVEIALEELKHFSKSSHEEIVDDEDYTISFYDNQITGKCKDASVDLVFVFKTLEFIICFHKLLKILLCL